MNKLLILIGSHRKNGYSKCIADYVCSIFENKYDIKVFQPINLNIKNCIACDKCKHRQGECVLVDDMNEIYEYLYSCQRLIVISPVYFNSAPSVLKTLIDRTQMCFNDKNEKPKKDAFIIGVGGAKSYEGQFVGLRKNFEHVFKSINAELKAEYGVSGTDHTNELVFSSELEKIGCFFSDYHVRL